MPWTAPLGQTCKRRFDTLVATFKREELLSLRASGTEEEYSEREQLLTNVVSLVSWIMGVSHVFMHM
ncbi:TPA: hypothetical protein N0F65_001631 [Lagenidium giganteum]|uniref:Uncharacterized protein n=1 Tax=Lagenidium giganteum TaxID=4803 RepID=A0AAV2YIX3_9STRA|nr:TPA: hypothetical protein N0F65_001631 [Lagenidium giganteum]